MELIPQKIQHLYWCAKFGILPKDIESSVCSISLNTVVNLRFFSKHQRGL